jgi:hypothetical protein
MSDRLVEDNDVSVDEVKEQSRAKHYSDMKKMKNLINAIDVYLITFGRTSNIHDELFDIKLQVIKNCKNLQNWIDQI